MEPDGANNTGKQSESGEQSSPSREQINEDLAPHDDSTEEDISSASNARSRIDRGFMADLMENVPSGDWTCLVCWHLNSARHFTCDGRIICGALKPVRSGPKTSSALATLPTDVQTPGELPSPPAVYRSPASATTSTVPFPSKLLFLNGANEQAVQSTIPLTPIPFPSVTTDVTNDDSGYDSTGDQYSQAPIEAWFGPPERLSPVYGTELVHGAVPIMPALSPDVTNDMTYDPSRQGRSGDQYNEASSGHSAAEDPTPVDVAAPDNEVPLDASSRHSVAQGPVDGAAPGDEVSLDASSGPSAAQGTVGNVASGNEVPLDASGPAAPQDPLDGAAPWLNESALSTVEGPPITTKEGEGATLLDETGLLPPKRDWICRQCGRKNFDWSTRCWRCHYSKKASVTKTQT